MTTYRFWVLVINHENKIIAPLIKLKVEKGAKHIADLKERLKEDQSPGLDHVPSGQLDLWKPLKDIGTTHFEPIIADLTFPENVGSGDEISGNLEFLQPSRAISLYWTIGLKQNCIHIIARVRRNHELSHEPPLKKARLRPRNDRGKGLFSTITPSRSADSRLSTLISGSDIVQGARELWEATWNYLGNGVPLCKQWSIERDGTFIDDLVEVPESCWIMAEPENMKMLGLPDNGALIRADYIDALKGLFSAARLDTSDGSWPNTPDDFRNPFLGARSVAKPTAGFILTGHPGIGKSIWLRLLLVLRLHAKLPTFFQPRRDELYYFNNEGAFIIKAPYNHQFVALLRRESTAWVLVDSTSDLTSVPPVLFESRAFVVQTTTPQPNRLAWQKKATPRPPLFCLQPWSLLELLMGRKLQGEPRSESQLVEFFQRYGPSPRNAYGVEIAMQENFIDGTCNTLTLEELRRLVAQACELQLGEDMFHDILILYPGEQRSDLDVRIASEFVYKKLVASLGSQTEHAASDLFSLFNSTKYTKGSAGFILDEIIRSFILKGGQWQMYAMEESSHIGDKNQNWKNPTNYDSSKCYLHVDSDGVHIENRILSNSQATPLKEFNFVPGTKNLQTGYYRPAFHNEATYNCFIYDERRNHAIVLQSSVSSTRSVRPSAGIQQLQKLGVTKFSYILFVPKSAMGSRADLPFLRDIDGLVPEKYLFFLESM